MNILRYFLGTRRKRWRFLILCITLAIAGYFYWELNEWIIIEINPGKAENLPSASKKRSYLLRPRVKSTVGTIAPKKRKKTGDLIFTVLPTTSRKVRPKKVVPTKVKAIRPTRKTKPMNLESSLSLRVSYNVHIFYYPWYGNPSVDGKYVHWNHQYLPHWNAEIAQNYRKGMHTPPDDIGSNFYPELGCYSSQDSNVIEEHMRQIRTSGAGVVAVSWYPKGKADDQGIPVDSLIPKLLDSARKFELKVTLHIEPYKNRDDWTVHEDVKYITEKYSWHPAFYKYKTKDNRYLPLLYVYDSYHTKPQQWAELLKSEGSHTIRNTPYDCIMIALMVKLTHREYIEIGGFDGFYTYFAADGFTYGSSWRSWSNLKSFAEQSNSIFIPSVGPGYIDTSIRPWNSVNTRARQNGDYYKRSFQAALSVQPSLISITSFNEWHEGTQIEKAVPKSISGFKYQDYLPEKPDYYLKFTRRYVDMFEKIG